MVRSLDIATTSHTVQCYALLRSVVVYRYTIRNRLNKRIFPYNAHVSVSVHAAYHA